MMRDSNFSQISGYNVVKRPDHNGQQPKSPLVSQDTKEVNVEFRTLNPIKMSENLKVFSVSKYCLDLQACERIRL
jgi:hypothetical protein